MNESTPRRSPGSLRRYLILSLGVTIIVTVCLSFAAESFVSTELLRKDQDLAEQAAGYLWNQIREHCIESDPADGTTTVSSFRTAELERVVKRFMQTSKIQIANVITANGLIIYSSNTAWIGQTLHEAEAVEQALAGVTTSELKKAGSHFDAGGICDQAMLETYVLAGELARPGGQSTEPIIIELYQPAAHFLIEIGRSRNLVITIALTSFLAMFLAHLWIFVQGHRTIVSRTRELEELSEHLEDQVERRTGELATSRRLADVGKLSAGIAHEVNTPLASIATSAEGLMARTEDPDSRRSLEIIRKEAFRVKSITRSLLNFSRLEPDPEEPRQAKRIPVRDVLDELQQLLKFDLAKRNVRFRVDIEPPDLAIMADPAAVHQIMLNVTQNSIDAVNDGGSIQFDVTRRGDAIRILCTDDGAGIPAEMLDQVLDPFVTTKSPDQGTGLGLAIAYSLASRQAGTLTVDSPGPNMGTTVCLLLPAG